MKDVLVSMWATILWRGIASIAFGLCAIFWPGNFLVVLTFIFGFYVLIEGALTFWSAFSPEADGSNRILILVTGVLSILAGLLAFFAPGLAAVYIVLLIGIWNVAMGVLKLISAIFLRKELQDEIWLAIAGILSIILGAAILGNWVIGAVSIAWLIGLTAIVVGIALVMFAWKLRSLGNKLLANRT